MRIATFNVENLFTRPTALTDTAGAAGRRAIEDHAEANAIAAHAVYDARDRRRLLALAARYGWADRNPPRDALVTLQKVRGQLYRRPQGGAPEVVAGGRGDWVGWFELRREDVGWTATANTARVIASVGADVQVCVEAEDRPTLLRFQQQVLGPHFATGYPHTMLIDGNDSRGIDVGVLSRLPIDRIRSHVDDGEGDWQPVFSRDSPEYDLLLPGGERLVVIPQHFKSKRNGNDRQSAERRAAQARRAHAIAVAALARTPYVIVAGDLNDTPDSAAIRPLLRDGFRDVAEHPSWPQDRPGTYQTGLASQKIDYLILSSALWPRLRAAGVERRGSWHPRLWTPFDTVRSAVDEASDHHCVWADLDPG